MLQWDAERQQCCNGDDIDGASERSSLASSQLFVEQAIFIGLAGPMGSPAQELMGSGGRWRQFLSKTSCKTYRV
jgi:hypothetical protein